MSDFRSHVLVFEAQCPAQPPHLRLLRGELEPKQNPVHKEAPFELANTRLSKSLSLRNLWMKKRSPILGPARSSCLIRLLESAIARRLSYRTPRENHPTGY